MPILISLQFLEEREKVSRFNEQSPFIYTYENIRNIEEKLNNWKDLTIDGL